MSNLQPNTKENPLSGFMRQPKIYVKLPSNGAYYTPGSIDIAPTGEYPVFSMTAKDELLLKVPDALLNGQAVVDVIQSCMPTIKNAWCIPNIDLDVILIAIRIATYGEKMKVPLTIKEDEFEYEIDLRNILDTLNSQIYWEEPVQITPELIIYVKPFDYKQMSNSAAKTFETQKMLQTVNDHSISDENKLKTIKTSIDMLNEITVGLVNSSVYKVDTVSGSTSEVHHIKEFMNNVDKEIFEKVQSHIEKIKENNAIKPLKVNPTPDMIARGAEDKVIEIPLSFDPSTFFA